MKKSYMRQVYMGTVGDMKNLEQHFSIMAEKGWMIDKIGQLTHRYRAVEPCKMHFFVDLLLKITAFDYPDNEDAKNYRSECEESGWTFVTANKQFHVFCADGENPVPMPVHTDNKTQAQTYIKACRTYELPWYILSLFLFLYSSPYDKGAEIFLSNTTLFAALGYFILFASYSWTFVFMIRWYLRTRKSAKNDLPMPAVNYRLARLRNNVFMAGTILFLVCIYIGVVFEIMNGMPPIILIAVLMPLSALGAGLWIRRQVDTKRRTRAGNIGLTIAVIIIMEIVVFGCIGLVSRSISSSSLPDEPDALGSRPALMLNDVGASAEPDIFNTRIKGTVVVPVNYEHWESNQEGKVKTQIYRSISSIITYWLYEYNTEKFIDYASYLSGKPESAVTFTYEEAVFWGAEKGMVFYSKNSNAIQLLLLNGKTLLWLSVEGVNMDLDTVSKAVQGLWND